MTKDCYKNIVYESNFFFVKKKDDIREKLYNDDIKRRNVIVFNFITVF